jgi:hypothetical protein
MELFHVLGSCIFSFLLFEVPGVTVVKIAQGRERSQDVLGDSRSKTADVVLFCPSPRKITSVMM